MTNKIAFPTRGQIYTLEEINKLPLRDSPCLRIFHNNRWEYVQNSSTDLGALCEKNPIIRDSRWVFERETHEWIPVFNFARDNEWPVELVVTMEPTKWVDIYGQPEPQQYVRFIGDYEPELTEFEQGMVDERKANPTPKPQAWTSTPEGIKEARQQLLEHAKEVFRSAETAVAAPVTQSPVSFPLEVMLQDPEKAKAYVEDRAGDATKFRASLQWKQGAFVNEAPLYFAGHIFQYLENHGDAKRIWGVYRPNKGGGSVEFKTEECFVAWVLAKFW